MPKITKTKSGKWHTQVYDYTDSNGKRHCKDITKATKAEVVQALAEFQVNRSTRTKIADVATVRGAVDKYINKRRGIKSPSTIQGYEKIAKYAFPTLMDMKMKDLDEDICQDAIHAEMDRTALRTGKQLAPKTIRERWFLIKSAIREASGMDIMCLVPQDKNEMLHLPDPSIVNKAITGLNTELACRLAFEMGLRMSEVRGLEYKHIKNGYIHIVQTKVVIYGHDTIKQNTKNKTSCRVVPISPNVMKLIEQTDAWNDKEGFLVDFSAAQLYSSIHNAMKPLGYDFNFHDLRHEFASTAINVLHIPVVVVQQLGGWADCATLFKRYVNNMDEVYNNSVSSIQTYFTGL